MISIMEQIKEKWKTAQMRKEREDRVKETEKEWEWECESEKKFIERQKECVFKLDDCL